MDSMNSIARHLLVTWESRFWSLRGSGSSFSTTIYCFINSRRSISTYILMDFELADDDDDNDDDDADADADDDDDLHFPDANNHEVNDCQDLPKCLIPDV